MLQFAPLFWEGILRHFRHLFSALFIAATLLSALHEVIHSHPHDLKGVMDQNCPLYLLSHTPALSAEGVSLTKVTLFFEPFVEPDTGHPFHPAVAARNRSPPFS